MKAKKLNQAEAKQLTDLLRRACAHNQLAVGVAAPLRPGEPDELGDGDRHDGNCHGSHEGWKPSWGMTTGEEPKFKGDKLVGWQEYTRPEVKLLIPDNELCFLVGVTVAEADAICRKRKVKTSA